MDSSSVPAFVLAHSWPASLCSSRVFIENRNCLILCFASRIARSHRVLFSTGFSFLPIDILFRRVIMLPMLDMYRNQIGACLLRIDELMEARKNIDIELAQLRKLALANAFLLTNQDERDAVVQEIDKQAATGFTQMIRNILRQNPQGLTPPEVRDALFGAGYDLSSQVNPLASIHS